MELPTIGANFANLKIGKVDLAKFMTLGAPIGAIAVSLIILILMVWPRLSEALKLRSSNVQLASQAEALAGKAQLLASLDKVDLDSQLGLAEQVMPSDKAVFSFVREVEGAAARNGVLLDKVDAAPGTLLGDSGQITPAAGAVVDPAPKIQVKIAMTSDYRSLLNFLSNMYAVSRAIGIRDFTISSGAAAGDSAGALKTSLVIDAYWKPLPPQLGSIESAVQLLTGPEEEILRRAKAAEIATPPAVVPTVPTGRADLFASF
ncbi:hypothetical protein HYZ70_02785 [Candidatus Curtissbacteria bacterium]|nr:hypothetical protein [Candidatus Curtissbacteria bacterium]